MNSKNNRIPWWIKYFAIILQWSSDASLVREKSPIWVLCDQENTYNFATNKSDDEKGFQLFHEPTMHYY